MNAAISTANPLSPDIPCRRDITGDQPSVLTDIYQDEANISIWQRQLSDPLIQATAHTLETKPALQMSAVVTPNSVYSTVHHALDATEQTAGLSEDIAQLVDMFCCLFELKSAGLRLTSLTSAMCPRFHVDRVPCRLVTTYCGEATQWLPHHLVDRKKLGAGNQGKPDDLSGLYNRSSDIQQLSHGDVALLKGELWEGNDGAGLVHRSPPLNNGARRLLLTLDFMND